jgi:4-hydroxy-2-oxoheptanedioate aldolase
MQTHPNKVKAQLAANRVVIGAKVDLPSPDIVEMVGGAGYDFVWIDREHGPFDLEMSVHMMRAADCTGTTPIVRVPNHNPTEIGRTLDAGAAGILVPNVASSAEAEAIVRAAKYQTSANPTGRRGACPRIRAAAHQAADWNTFADWSNDNTLVWALVETVEAADKVDSIAQAPGIDAIMLGPFDLSVSMGLAGKTSHPDVQRKMEEIAKAALRRKVDVVGVLLANEPAAMEAEQKYWTNIGCRLFNIVSDRRLIAANLASAISNSRRTASIPPKAVA